MNIRNIILTGLISINLFALTNETDQTQKKNINNINNQANKQQLTKKISRNEMIKLAQQHYKYVINYEDFLKKLSQHKLDYKKPVILFIGTPDCKWTKQEMLELLGYPPLWEEIRDNFTLVYVNLLKDKLPESFLISITPTMYFVSPIDGKIITDKPVAGYVDKNELVSYLKGLKKAWDIYLEKIKKKTASNTKSTGGIKR